MKAATSACNAAASIALAPSPTSSSNSDPPTAAGVCLSGSDSSCTTLSTGVPSRTSAPNVGPDQNLMTSRSSSGGCALSRHRAEGHPQVLIIAPGSGSPTGTGQGHPPVYRICRCQGLPGKGSVGIVSEDARRAMRLLKVLRRVPGPLAHQNGGSGVRASQFTKLWSEELRETTRLSTMILHDTDP